MQWCINYSHNQEQKQTFPIDVTRVSTDIGFMLSSIMTNAVRQVCKTWHDIIAVSSNSAKYAMKMAEVAIIVHVLDVSRLRCVTVNRALLSVSVSDVRKVVTKLSVVFTHAH